MVVASRLAETLRHLPPWAWTRPVGLLVGVAGVAGLTGALLLADRRLIAIPTPSLFYLLLVVAVAFGWGGRVGVATAVASFLAIWFFFVASPGSLAISAVSDWTSLILVAITLATMALLGDALRRLRRANARLGGMVERLNAIIASIADGVLVLDTAGNLLQTNDAMRRIHGGELPLTLAERAATWRTRHPDGSPLVHGAGPTTAALAGAITTGYEVVINTADGRVVPLSVSGAPVRGRGGAIVGAVIVCRDVSEVRRLQQAKDDFLSIASHELKTPLTSLRGYAQLLRQRIARAEIADERIGRYLATIDRQTQRMGELVDTLLDLSRLDAGRLQIRRETFDLVALVREIADQLGELSSRHPISVTAETPTALGDWDRDRVEQIVVNLVTNAIRYSPDGGPVEVTVGVRPVVAGTGAADDVPTEAFVEVRDRGVGIPAEQLEKIFERFHRAHEEETPGFAEAQRGMGLGLYIARELAERHGGRLRAASPGHGRGATFTLTLPRQPAASLARLPGAGDGQRKGADSSLRSE